MAKPKQNPSPSPSPSPSPNQPKPPRKRSTTRERYEQLVGKAAETARRIGTRIESAAGEAAGKVTEALADAVTALDTALVELKALPADLKITKSAAHKKAFSDGDAVEIKPKFRPLYENLGVDLDALVVTKVNGEAHACFLGDTDGNTLGVVPWMRLARKATAE